MAITALNSGLRRGEIFNLKKSDIDFRNGFILVEDTKNGEGRKIPMNERLTETLKKVTNRPDSPFVFASKDGLPYKDIKNGWWAVTEKAGLKGFRFHDLRHTFATRVIMAGVDIVTVAELLGHKNIKMTMRYSHPTPEHKKAAVRILDGVTTILTTQPKKKILPITKSLDIKGRRDGRVV